MKRYLLMRLAAAAITLFLILSLAFFVVRLMPGSVYDDPNLDQSIIDLLNQRAHLDKPVFVQYLYFLKGVIADFDFGVSIKIQPGVPVFKVLFGKIPVSLTLNLLSLILAIPVGLAAGIAAAVKKGRVADAAISTAVVLFISVPSFVFASMMQYFLAYKLGLFPILYLPSAPFFQKLHSMALPLFALAVGPIASITRYLRGELSELANADFMLLAKTKGLSKLSVILRHGLRNAALPMMSIIIPMFANILGGSMIIEGIFSIPGVGGTMIKSINANDHPLTVAALVFYAAVSVLAMFLVDISYILVDPRVRIWGKKP